MSPNPYVASRMPLRNINGDMMPSSACVADFFCLDFDAGNDRSRRRPKRPYSFLGPKKQLQLRTILAIPIVYTASTERDAMSAAQTNDHSLEKEVSGNEEKLGYVIARQFRTDWFNS